MEEEDLLQTVISNQSVTFLAVGSLTQLILGYMVLNAITLIFDTMMHGLMTAVLEISFKRTFCILTQSGTKLIQASR